jgi:hypothetical protein
MHPMECSLRAKCKRWDCPWMHPNLRSLLCFYGENCTNVTCLSLHPPTRVKLLCPIGVDCHDFSCRRNDLLERARICDQPDTSSKLSCISLHETDLNPHEAEDNCEDEQYAKIDLPERVINVQEKTAAVAKLPLIFYYFSSVISNNNYYFYYFLSFISIYFIFIILMLLEILSTLISEI